LPAPERLSRKSTSRSIPTGLGALLVAFAFVVAPALAGSPERNGGTTYYGHVFPVGGSHGTRGAIGEFGAPRSGGRRHEGFDIVAACGTPLVAVRGGRVLRRGYDSVLYGNYLLIHGEGEDRSYFYAHLPRPALVHKGRHVWTGERVGAVGATGNARTVGCHLHF
jgi:murein DD-endopeptidase MepM/ murein hydrolase activator NlpD